MVPPKTPDLSTPDEPLPPELSDTQAADGMEKPLGPAAAGLILKFLDSHPDLELFAEDMNPDNGNGHGPFKLIHGTNDTLQAEVRKDRLAIFFHPGRFVLTKASLRLYRQTLLSERLSVMATFREESSFMDDVIADRRRRVEEDQKSMRAKLQAKLQAEMGNSNTRLGDSGKLVTVHSTESTIRELASLARRAGFTVEAFHYPERHSPHTYEGISGTVAGQMATDALHKSGHGKLVRALCERDKHGTGPYGIIFQPNDKRLLILNKEAILNL